MSNRAAQRSVSTGRVSDTSADQTKAGRQRANCPAVPLNPRCQVRQGSGDYGLPLRMAPSTVSALKLWGSVAALLEQQHTLSWLPHEQQQAATRGDAGTPTQVLRAAEMAWAMPELFTCWGGVWRHDHKTVGPLTTARHDHLSLQHPREVINPLVGSWLHILAKGSLRQTPHAGAGRRLSPQGARAWTIPNMSGRIVRVVWERRRLKSVEEYLHGQRGRDKFIGRGQ
jgi:hypothetical protein